MSADVHELQVNISRRTSATRQNVSKHKSATRLNISRHTLASCSNSEYPWSWSWSRYLSPIRRTVV